MTEIKTVGVCGSGTMGAGIAIVAARAGYRTVVFDENADALTRAEAQTESFFAKSVERGKMAEAEKSDVLARFERSTDISAMATADVVIEAVVEDLAVKRALFARLNEVCPEHALFASNTSTLSITEIAGGCGREDRVAGMHFCLPAQLMKLVEMSPGLNTSPESFTRAWAFCEALGQRPVQTKDSPGFVLNYFLVPFNNDVIRMVEAGVAEPGAIDQAIKTGLGYKMGPCELLDLVGLDTQILLCDAFYGVTHDPRAAAPPLLKRMVAAGQLGRKSGRGFFDYGRDAMFGG